MQGDLFGGRYSVDEVQRIMEVNARPHVLKKPYNAFYKKTGSEHGPSWNEKKEFVHWLIHESTITPASKVYLQEQEHWIPKYQFRGLKYGITTSLLTYFFFPVIRKQPFLRRFAISMVPMVFFMRWGYVWGHENYWRRVKEVVVTYEIYSGARSKFTMK